MQTLLFRLLLLVVVLSPLPFGGHRPWAWSALACAVSLLLGAWAAGCAAGRFTPAVAGKRLWPAIPWSGIALYAALQASGLLPPDIEHPIWSDTAETLGQSVTGYATVDPARSWTALMKLLTYAGVFFLAAQLCRDRQRAHQTVLALAMSGIVYATYGLFGHFSGAEKILWFPKWSYIGDLVGTFVNRNSFGAYAGIILLCCVSLVLPHLSSAAHRRVLFARDRVEFWMLRVLPLMAGVLVLSTALLLSHSRGAFLATGMGMLALVLSSSAARLLASRSGAVLLTSLAVTAGAAILIGGDGTIGRLLETPELVEGREQLFRLTARAILDAPWSGSGLGAFEPAFRVYRDASLPTPVVWDFAHNIYLEAAMEMGLVMAALYYLTIGGVLLCCLRGIGSRRRDQAYPILALAAATLLGVHGMVDFSAQIPAIAMTFALILGTGYAQSWSTGQPAS